MVCDNETVADIVREIRDRNPCIRFPAEYGGGEVPNEACQLADRIEAAHRCDVDELRECLQLAVEMKCANCGLCIKGAESCYPDWQIVHHEDCWMIMKWRKALEGANNDGK